MMEYIQVTKDNLQKEHICCAIYAVFHDGEYVTNEQMNDKRFLNPNRSLAL